MKKYLSFLLFILLLTACSSPTGSATSGQVTPIQESNGPFTLTILSPADEAEVGQSEVDIHGDVSESAVITINDDTYTVKKGTFTEPVQLEEGLNAIQIAASDMNGNEVDLILTITYQP